MGYNRDNKLNSRAAGLIFLAILTVGCSTAPPADPQSSFIELRASAEQALDAGDLATALVRLRQLQGNEPESVATLRLVARLHAMAEDTNAERAVMQQILQLDPQDVDALHWMGMYYLHRGLFDAADEYLHLVIRQNPRHWQSYNGLGVAANARGRVAEAERYYLQGLSIVPAQPKLTANLGWTRVLTGDLEDGEALLRESLRLAPTAIVTRSNLAFAVALQGRYDEAMALYTDLYDKATAANNVGYAAIHRGDHQTAARYLRLAIETRPSFYEKAANNLALIE